jgi:hypothetical protein
VKIVSYGEPIPSGSSGYLPPLLKKEEEKAASSPLKNQ